MVKLSKDTNLVDPFAEADDMRIKMEDMQHQINEHQRLINMLVEVCGLLAHAENGRLGHKKNAAKP